MRSIIRNKKADMPSLITMVAVVFMLAVSIVIFWYVFNEFADELKVHDSVAKHNKSVSVIEIVQDRGTNLLDFLVFFTMIGLMIGIIISAIYIPSHPALVGTFILVMVIAIFLSGMFVNVYDKIEENPTLAATASEFTMTKIIMGKSLPIIITFLTMIVIIIFYGKSRRVTEV